MENFTIIKIVGIAFLTSYLFTFLIKKIAKHVNAIDVPNKRSSHTMHKLPIPRMGGLAIFISVLLGSLLFFELSKELMAIIIGSFIIILTGIVDDINPIKARYKFYMQIIATLIIVVYGGIYFNKISLFGLTLNFNDYIGQFLSVFFMLSIINAMNLIDGLDGLASGISLIYFLTIGIIGFVLEKLTGLDMMLTMVMFGGTLGFLIHNFPPAKIFLGDTGSMFLGFIIPVIAILGLREKTFSSIAIPAIILGIPILDTILAIIRRAIRRKKVYDADKEHFHHQVLKLNLPLYVSVLIIYGISVLFSILGIFYATKSLIPFIILAVVLLTGIGVLIAISSILFEKSKGETKGKGQENKNKNNKSEKDKK